MKKRNLDEKQRLQIRKVSVETQQKLKQVATKNGYDSRDEFLRDILEKIANEEYVLASEIRYQELVKRQEQFMGWLATEVINVSYAKFESNPFEN